MSCHFTSRIWPLPACVWVDRGPCWEYLSPVTHALSSSSWGRHRVGLSPGARTCWSGFRTWNFCDSLLRLGRVPRVSSPRCTKMKQSSIYNSNLTSLKQQNDLICYFCAFQKLFSKLQNTIAVYIWAHTCYKNNK